MVAWPWKHGRETTSHACATKWPRKGDKKAVVSVRRCRAKGGVRLCRHCLPASDSGGNATRARKYSSARSLPAYAPLPPSTPPTLARNDFPVPGEWGSIYGVTRILRTRRIGPPP
jgi:hypothetical protein